MSAGVLKLVTASTTEPVSLNEAKLFLRLDEHDPIEDDLVAALITRARQSWEERTQRAAMLQTFDYYLDETPHDTEPITIPKAPLVSVESIKGFKSSELTDTGGTAMSTSGYYVDTASEFGRVIPTLEFTLPTATRPINACIIRFTAGYSSNTTGVPENVKTEIKQLVAKLYEHRGDEVAQANALLEYPPLSELDLPTWG